MFDTTMRRCLAASCAGLFLLAGLATDTPAKPMKAPEPNTSVRLKPGDTAPDFVLTDLEEGRIGGRLNEIAHSIELE